MKRSFLLILIFTCTAHVGCDDDVPTPSSTSNSVIVSPSTQQPFADTVVKLTPAAMREFRDSLSGSPDSYIRLSVRTDGAKFSYDLQIKDQVIPAGDRIDQSYGFKFVVSQRDALYLEGTTIDWVTRSDGTSGFSFDNPKAKNPTGG